MTTPPKKPDFSNIFSNIFSKASSTEKPKVNFSNPPSKATASQKPKADFSNVQSKTTGAPKPKADFSNVQSTVTSSEQVILGGGGGGEPARTYTVEKGDTLSHIAKRFYGKAGKWPEIYDANRDQLDNPDRIKPGQVLRIPSLDDGAD